MHLVVISGKSMSRDRFPDSPFSLFDVYSHLLPSILRPHLHTISESFNLREYRTRNHDLKALPASKLVQHFFRDGISEPRHWLVGPPLLDRRFAWAVQSGDDLHLSNRIQVLIHCYHYSVLCNLQGYLRNLARLGAFICLLVVNDSLVDEVLDDYVHSLYTGCARHIWVRVPNHGEDWSSFHYAFAEGMLDHSGITLKIQTKRSFHLGSDGGLLWLDEALGPLCGNQQCISNVLKSIYVGNSLVCASNMTRRSGFGVNKKLLVDVINRLGLPDSTEWDKVPFAAGSMFASCNSHIRQFYKDLGEVDYSIGYGGTPFCGRFMGHALERVFFYYTLHCNPLSGTSWI